MTERAGDGCRRDLKKESKWRQILRRFEGSGVSAMQFCKREGLSLSLFYCWRKTIKRRDSECQEGPRTARPCNPFVPLRIAGGEIDRDNEAPIEIALPGGALVRVTDQTNLVLLCRILTTLEKSSC